MTDQKSSFASPPKTLRKPKVNVRSQKIEEQADQVQQMVEAAYARSPGRGPRNQAYGYTSEREIRDNVMEAIQRPKRKLTASQIAAAGLDNDPALAVTVAKSKQAPISDEKKLQIAEDWISKQIESARINARLMTDQQLEDWRSRRLLKEGDRARFVGVERIERTQADLLVKRPHGQEGIIVHVERLPTGTLYTFRPDDPVMPEHAAPDVDKQFVDLQVREHTAGWLTIERIPGVRS